MYGWFPFRGEIFMENDFVLSYDRMSESVIKPCIKNDNPLVD